MVKAYATDCPCGLEALASWMLFPIEGVETTEQAHTAMALAYFIKPYSLHASPSVQRLSAVEWQTFWDDPSTLSCPALGCLNPLFL